MDIFENRYYRMNRYIMEIIGQWPYQSSKQRKFKWFLIYLIIGTVILVQTLKVIQLWGAVDIIVECMMPLGGNVMSLIKSSNCVSNRLKMRRLLNLIKKDWSSISDEEEIQVLLRFVERGGFFTSIYVACIFGSLITFLIVPLMPQILDIIIPINETRPRRLLHQAEYYVDPDDYYLFIMIHTYVATTLTVTIFAGADAMLVAYVHHICGMFTIIGHRIENTMSLKVETDFLEEATTHKIYEDIVNCIKDHERAIEFARLLESAYSTTFLFQLGVSMLMISATGLQIIAKLDEYDEVIKFGQSVLAQLTHLYFISWTGQMLIDHSEMFRHSLYFTDWYRFPIRGKHAIRLALVRTLEPCKITAGKIYHMSMESFGQVVQTSVSYFMVLVSLR